MESLNIAIACDHAGYAIKEKLKPFIESLGHTLHDFGTHSEASVDYPDFIHPLASAVESKQYDLGIILCGSGNGVNITANKHQGIRSALCWCVEIARLARQHNNANVCAIPARFIGVDIAKQIAEEFLKTPFEGGRHQARVDKIPVK